MKLTEKEICDAIARKIREKLKYLPITKGNNEKRKTLYHILYALED